ncbi:MAG: GlxA family transcriptional regulator [Pseudomonadota bacterium]
MGGTAGAAPTSIGFLLIPRFNMMALVATIEPLRVANYVATRPLYRWDYLSPDGAEVTASNGMVQATQALEANKPSWDWVFFCGSWQSEHYDNPKLFAWLRRLDRRGVTLGAMDNGAYVLARAKLLAGHRATVHWHGLGAFAEQYPATAAADQLYVIDRKRMTIAGGTAGLDLMLALIERDHGQQLALEVADQILHTPRDGERRQRQTLGGKQKTLHPIVRKAVELMEDNLEEPLAVPDLAARLEVSQRKLERLFKSFMGCSVIALYQAIRLQNARVLLTNTKLSVRQVSVACGFASLSYFSKCFAAHFGKKPRDYREAWPEPDPAPLWPGTLFAMVEANKITET